MKWQRKPVTGSSEPGQPEATLVEAKQRDYSYSTLNSGAVCSSKFPDSKTIQVLECIVLPVSPDDAQNHASVSLSNLQLYQRSECSVPSQTHQD